ncbi:MAG: hypothetical protein CMP20_01895 [Rickettsiales bacterium]|nr:hypothetical protein [Rickettsiales bacterium]
MGGKQSKKSAISAHWQRHVEKLEKRIKMMLPVVEKTVPVYGEILEASYNGEQYEREWSADTLLHLRCRAFEEGAVGLENVVEVRKADMWAMALVCVNADPVWPDSSSSDSSYSE